MLTGADKEEVVRRLVYLQDELEDGHLYRKNVEPLAGEFVKGVHLFIGADKPRA